MTIVITSKKVLKLIMISLNTILIVAALQRPLYDLPLAIVASIFNYLIYKLATLDEYES